VTSLAARSGQFLVGRPMLWQRSRLSARVVVALLLRLGSAGLLITIGVIHLYLWATVYRDLPTNGPLFMVDAVSAFVLAAALLVWPRVLIALLGMGFAAATLGALLISLNFGLFGFREFSDAPYVHESIVIESITIVCLAAWIAIVSIHVPREGRG
jgi:hypothetical protein